MSRCRGVNVANFVVSLIAMPSLEKTKNFGITNRNTDSTTALRSPFHMSGKLSTYNGGTKIHVDSREGTDLHALVQVSRRIVTDAKSRHGVTLCTHVEAVTHMGYK